MILTALGAYGRIPTKADWDAGKDFRVYDGPYFSKRDVHRLRGDGYTGIEFVHNGHILFTEKL